VGLSPLLVELPVPCLVVLIGPSGAGKSTWARRRFAETEVVSSDRCRALVCDDEAEQAANPYSFPLMHHLIRARLGMRRTTVVDATNVTKAARTPLVRLSREAGLPSFAILFDLPLETCIARDASRPDRHVGERVVSNHQADLRRGLMTLPDEGFAKIFAFLTVEQADAAEILRLPAPAL
jgi:protein phosphatase